jgi:hypothetical protein
MKAKEITMIEGKKNRRDKKHSIKPRNPVAHAAQSVAKGSGSHTNKKKAEPKHKKDAMHAEASSYPFAGAKVGHKAGTAGQWRNDGPSKNRPAKAGDLVGGESIANEVAPKGWEGTVKAMKKHDEIDNPYALAWSMKNKGYKSHKQEEGAEFGANYAEQLAQKVFDENPDLPTDGRGDEYFNAAWPHMVADLGKKRASYELNYDEDFPSDTISAYSYLQKQKTAESIDEEGFKNYYDSDGNDLRGGNDESNLWYKYDPEDGRLKQKMIPGHQERQAKAEGYRDGMENALRVHNIIRSKFDPKKWVQKQGPKWVQVFPFGK